MSHVTSSGDAVVVTATPPAAADALTGWNAAASIHNHASRFTS
jgi:hypothetical protein